MALFQFLLRCQGTEITFTTPQDNKEASKQALGSSLVDYFQQLNCKGIPGFPVNFA